MRFAKMASAKMDYFLQIILFIFFIWAKCLYMCVCVRIYVCKIHL